MFQNVNAVSVASVVTCLKPLIYVAKNSSLNEILREFFDLDFGLSVDRQESPKITCVTSLLLKYKMDQAHRQIFESQLPSAWRLGLAAHTYPSEILFPSAHAQLDTHQNLRSLECDIAHACWMAQKLLN